jgi:hypothetical protein
MQKINQLLTYQLPLGSVPKKGVTKFKQPKYARFKLAAKRFGVNAGGLWLPSLDFKWSYKGQVIKSELEGYYKLHERVNEVIIKKQEFFILTIYACVTFDKTFKTSNYCHPVFKANWNGHNYDMKQRKMIWRENDFFDYSEHSKIHQLELQQGIKF